jgi:hypothetical protein
LKRFLIDVLMRLMDGKEGSASIFAKRGADKGQNARREAREGREGREGGKCFELSARRGAKEGQGMRVKGVQGEECKEGIKVGTVWKGIEIKKKPKEERAIARRGMQVCMESARRKGL